MPQKKTDESPSSSPLTIQLPGIEDNAKEKNPQKEKQVDILKEISKKLSTLISAVNVIKDDIHDMKEQTVSKTVTTNPNIFREDQYAAIRNEGNTRAFTNKYSD